MAPEVSLSLVVIRVSDLEESGRFYSTVGLELNREKHGTGPEHFAIDMGGTVLELYAATSKYPVTSVRLGFLVESVEETVERIRSNGYSIVREVNESAWGIRAVVADPDGHRVEITKCLAG